MRGAFLLLFTLDKQTSLSRLATAGGVAVEAASPVPDPHPLAEQHAYEL